MAVGQKALILYGYTVTQNNQNLTFSTTNGTFTATISVGYYSLATLLTAIQTAMQSIDTSDVFNLTADRTLSGGTQNRITINCITSASFSLLFSSGNANNLAAILGFATSDFTGSTSYTGTLTTGIGFQPTQFVYTYVPSSRWSKRFGSVNISASGVKEAIVFGEQNFWSMQFKFEQTAAVISNWEPVISWLAAQRPIDFTPDITIPGTFGSGTLEKPALELSMTEMLPQLPNHWQTPLMTFRKAV